MEVEHLVAEYRQLILGTAFRIVRDSSGAEDVYQETLLKIWQCLPRFRHECSMASWIATIARNASIDHIRKATKHSGVSLANARETLTQRCQLSLQVEMRQLVERLPERQRIVIELFYFDQWPIKDIAAALGLPNVTVRGRLHCARRGLFRAVSRRS
jgi:RNA polymerase sigma-70 factor, ECF subfamily